MSTRINLTLALAAALSLTACSGGSSGGPASSATMVVTAPTSAATAATTSASAAPAPTPSTASTPASTTSSAPASTPTTASPTTTVTTTAAAPPTSDATITPAPAAPATSTSASGTRRHPPVQGEPGGTVTLAGRSYGRGEGSTQAFLSRMGTPDATDHQSCEVAGANLPMTVYRWGGLSVVVPDQQPGGDYGFSWPKGSIGGWSIVAGPDGAQGLTGPKGTTLGTPLSTLQQRFTTKDWDDASVSTHQGVSRFSIFAGDTTGASFTLDSAKRVSEMSAGLGC